jgi:hypothetical protein
MILRAHIPSAADPATPQFWFVMSMGLLAGFILAYPMNWWLVTYHLKHGMMTVRPGAAGSAKHGAQPSPSMAHAKAKEPADGGQAPQPPVPVMTLLSFVALAAGVAIGFL